MPNENVGIKTGIQAKLQTVDDKGEVTKTTFFFPDLGVSVDAADEQEARKMAEEKAASIKNSQK